MESAGGEVCGEREIWWDLSVFAVTLTS